MIFIVSIWAIAVNWLAYNKGFYHVPQQRSKAIPRVTTPQLLVVFGLYLFLFYIVTRLLVFFIIILMRQINPELLSPPISVVTGLQLFIMLSLFFLLQWYSFEQDNPAYYKLWKNKSHVPCFPIGFDFSLGVITWFLSFPIVTVVSDLVDKVLKVLFNYEHLEQNAVKFVKVASDSPFSLLFALASVLIMAPLIEEFLFRGVLQTYLKKRLGAAAAILISALLFAFFHFSMRQGLGNVSLIISLFILGGFLGFLYEKQGSLWAPIGLHFIFNAVSAMRIIFFAELT